MAPRKSISVTGSYGVTADEVELFRSLEANRGLTDEELIAPVSHDELDSEKITAPRYSYWRSVFRVVFRKKINLIGEKKKNKKRL